MTTTDHLPVITIIVACTRDFGIGRGGDMLFHISEDLKRFKALTMGAPIIMGRKTFESLPKGALPGRRNIVITRRADYSAPGIETVGSLDEAMELCRGTEECFIIGGGEIYAQALPIASKIELTYIDTTVGDADTYFPDLTSGRWNMNQTPEFDHVDPKTGVRYAFMTLFPILGK